MGLPKKLASELAKATAVAGAQAVAPVVGPAAVSALFNIWQSYRKDRFDQYILGLFRKGLDPNDASVFQEVENGPIRLGLMDAGARHAVAAASDQRVEHIAALVSDGVRQKSTAIADRHFLLELLSQINDIEVLWLLYVGLPKPDANSFWHRHKDALYKPTLTRFSSQADVRRSTIHSAYVAHLAGLGLVLPSGAVLTELGRILLHSIEQLPAERPADDATYEAVQRDGSERVPRALALLRPVVERTLKQLCEAHSMASPTFSDKEDRNFAFQCQVATESGDRQRMMILLSAGGSYLQGNYEVVGPDGKLKTVSETPTARVEVREDGHGLFFTINTSREDEVHRVVEYLLEPLATRLLKPTGDDKPRRGPAGRNGSQWREPERFRGR